MERTTISPLEKENFSTMENKNTVAATGCCGGTATNNTDACCKLDEEKKAEGEEGCGCNTAKEQPKKSSCC